MSTGGQVDLETGALRVLNVGSAAGSSTQTSGDVPAGATDSGNPVKVAGVYNTTPPTLTNGQRGNVQLDAQGDVKVTIIGADGATNIGNLRIINSDGSAALVNALNTAANSYVFNGTSWDRQRGDTTGAYVISKGGGNMATGQVAVTTSATLVAAARTGRQKITLSSTSAVVFYVGGSGVTTANGLYVAAAAGASVTLDTSAAVYAVGAAAVTISYVELY